MNRLKLSKLSEFLSSSGSEFQTDVVMMLFQDMYAAYV